MVELSKKDLGFNEVENFRLGLKYNLKSEKLRDKSNKPIQKVIKSAMNLKMRDEIHHLNELKRKREERRKQLTRKYHPNTVTYKKVIKFLRGEAERMKKDQREKNWKKLQHLKRKHKEDEEEKLAQAPPGMESMSHLSVFDNEKYDEIETDKVIVPKIGEITLSEEEESILKRNPKFSLPQAIAENGLDMEMEKAYAKMRMELREEETGEEEEETAMPRKERSENTEEKRKETGEEMRELEAKSRQIYDPITNTYDDRNRRATDLKECSRVTLPKPISVKREAQIEIRREIHGRIFREYRKKYCRENGEQEMNLNVKEKKGLEILRKRIQDEEVLIMKTDKSGKLSVTSREKYIEMGREHTENDEEVGRVKLREIDKTMSDHATAWVGI